MRTTLKRVQTRVLLAVCICTVASMLFFLCFYRSGALPEAEGHGKEVLLETDGKSKSNGTTRLLNTLAEGHGNEVLLETDGKSKTTRSLVTPGLPAHHGTQGYMLALSYSDQITGSIANVKSLMCLAQKIGGVQVVEPFVAGSHLGMNISANWTREVRMMDIFDRDVFKKDTLGELASFETFLRNNPRKLVMVQYCHAPFCLPCKDEGLISKTRVFCEWNGLELVGVECVDLRKKTVSLTAIKAYLYSKYSKFEVVILFDLYGGILNGAYNPDYGHRIFSNVEECRRQPFTFSSMAPSKSVLSDVDRYIQKYFNGSAYISLMIRMEKVFIQARIKEEMQKPKIAKQCFDNLLRKLNDIGKSTGLKKIFLTIDIGRYGSDFFRLGGESERAIEEHVEEFLSTIYGRNMSLGEWEETFISTCKLNNAGYVSIVQKQIAARGEVLLLSGPDSSYQQSAKEIYEKLHKKRQVYLITRRCS